MDEKNKKSAEYENLSKREEACGLVKKQSKSEDSKVHDGKPKDGSGDKAGVGTELQEVHDDKLKWIHLRYHPPGLILQYINEETGKAREKMVDLLDFNHFSSLDETAQILMKAENIEKNNKLTLLECLQKLRVRCRPDFKKQFQLKHSVVKTHTFPILSACLSRDGSRFATASFDKTCKIWNTTTGAELATLSGHFDACCKCLFNVDGDKVITGSYDGTVRLWAVPGQETEKSLNKGPLSSIHVFHGSQGEIESIDYSLDGLMAASGGSGDRTARIYDLASGMTTHSFEGHAGNVTTVQFDRRCTGFLTGSRDGQLGIWDLRQGKLNEFLRGHTAEVMNCSFDYFGNQVVSCSVDKLVNIWDMRNTGTPIKVLTDNTDAVWDVKFNCRCRLLASGAKDGRLIIWDIQKGIIIANKKAHSSAIHQLCFNAAGTHILTSSGDSDAKLWIADAGECCQSLEGHGEKVIHGSFNYLGDRILTVASTGTCNIWE